MLLLDESWVWDFWLADDGDLFHAFFLHAPKTLGDDSRRHRHARIGHATSHDLVSWEVIPGNVIDVGAPGSFDDTATWTGNVVHDGTKWWMFYTGSHFLAPEPHIANIETIGAATSSDLMTWTKQPGPILRADPRWYETWGTSSWKEEAWRDPWVFADPDGQGWHMLITARADNGPIDDRGVVGHAVSADLVTWEARPPLTRPGAGFAHLEVPQVEQADGRWTLLFSSGEDTTGEALKARYPRTATWGLELDDPRRPFDLSGARPVLSDDRYSGRLIRTRSGDWVVLAFRTDVDGEFIGGIADPVPFVGVGHGFVRSSNDHVVKESSARLAPAPRSGRAQLVPGKARP